MNVLETIGVLSRPILIIKLIYINIINLRFTVSGHLKIRKDIMMALLLLIRHIMLFV